MNELASTDFHPHGEEFNPPKRDENRRGGKLNNEPDSYDEVYESLESTFADDQKSWNNFRKSMNSDGVVRTRQSAPITAGDDTLAESQPETREEYIDRFGYLHTTVKKKTLDNEGNEIGNETYVTIRSADENDRNRLESDGQSGGSKSGEKKGWFWK